MPPASSLQPPGSTQLVGDPAGQQHQRGQRDDRGDRGERAAAALAAARRRASRRPRAAPTPTTVQPRPGSAGSSIDIQCSAPHAASATNAIARASGDRQERRAGRGPDRGPVAQAGATALRRRPGAARRRAGGERVGARRGRPLALRSRRALQRRDGGGARVAARRRSRGSRRPRGSRGGRPISPGTTTRQPPGRAAEAARRAVDGAGGDVDHEPAAVLGRGQRRAGAVVQQREAHVQRPARPAGRARSRRRGGRPAAAASSRSCARSARRASRRRGPPRRAPRARTRARGSITTSGRESASEISLRSIRPGAARERLPVDARGGRALAPRPQAVDLGLGGGQQRRARVRRASRLPRPRSG